eukprot:CAMPEP_0173078306 /NCGR_PEP_ID=MMETSP1102-20130122/14013_1 /TAXON_ID=49646 /ORGANISM="Geminigera sp., Strain Caron Lab Isolate" /LENGTH=207 /DNA_ID=CAMNT_0013949499 /DNA_START=30 /DNA_END=653 /DNA_ORIENTATION=+
MKGVPFEMADPLRIAYRTRFAEMTVSDPHSISLAEFLGIFEHGSLHDANARRQEAHLHEAKIIKWFHEMTSGGTNKAKEVLTRRRMRFFMQTHADRAKEMGFTSTNIEAIDRIFRNLDMDASGQVDQAEFLAFFGFGPLSDAAAHARVQAMKDDVLHRNASNKAAAEGPPGDKATYRQKQLRKGGARRLGADGKLHSAQERWKTYVP